MSKRKKIRDAPSDSHPLSKKLPGGQLRLSSLTLRPSGDVSQSSTWLRPSPPVHAEIQHSKPPSTAAQTQEWVDKHSPQSLGDIAVAKKKVQQVQEWLEPFRDGAPHPSHARVLLLTGPPGCGKTTLVRLLAQQLAFDLVEWHPSANASWADVQHSREGALHLQYTPKLREFEDFAARVKMPALAVAPSQAMSQSQPPSQHQRQRRQQQVPSQHGQQQRQQQQGRQRPTLLMVEDMPHASGPASRGQLAEALRYLVTAARMPVVVMATESTGSGRAEDLDSASGGCHGLHKDLVAALEACNTRQLHLNPVTTAATAKVLSAIAEEESRELLPADAKQLAAASAGDLRSAVATLQMLLCGTKPAPRAKGRKGAVAKRKRTSGAAEPAATQQIGFAGRDQGLTLFHALGKLLYNKRVEPDDSGQPAGVPSQPASSASQAAPGRPGTLSQHASSQPSGIDFRAPGVSLADSPGRPSAAASASQPQQQPDVIDLTDEPAAERGAGAAEPEPPDIDPRYQRLPLQCNPEAVLVQAGLEAPSVAAFLHENVPDFIGDGGMQSAADVFGYLSESDQLMAFRRNDSAATGAAEVDEYAVTSMADSIAAQVAARGVLYGNVDQAPRRFMQMRAPVLFLVQRGVAANSSDLAAMAQLWCSTGSLSGLSAGTAAAQVMPFVRAIAAAAPQSQAAALRPARWQRLWNGRLTEEVLSGSGTAPAAPHLQDGILGSDGEEDDDIDAVEMD